MAYYFAQAVPTFAQGGGRVDLLRSAESRLIGTTAGGCQNTARQYPTLWTAPVLMGSGKIPAATYLQGRIRAGASG
jgi:hypothetical protein